jgi:hypothetical protein
MDRTMVHPFRVLAGRAQDTSPALEASVFCRRAWLQLARRIDKFRDRAAVSLNWKSEECSESLEPQFGLLSARRGELTGAKMCRRKDPSKSDQGAFGLTTEGC